MLIRLRRFFGWFSALSVHSQTVKVLSDRLRTHRLWPLTRRDRLRELLDVALEGILIGG